MLDYNSNHENWLKVWTWRARNLPPSLWNPNDDNLAKLELPWKAERPSLVALLREMIKEDPVWDFMVNGRRVTRRAEAIIRQRRHGNGNEYSGTS